MRTLRVREGMQRRAGLKPRPLRYGTDVRNHTRKHNTREGNEREQ